MQGTVDRLVANEGYGFIVGPNGEEYFFHRTGIKGAEWEELGPGVPVYFQVEQGRRPARGTFTGRRRHADSRRRAGGGP